MPDESGHSVNDQSSYARLLEFHLYEHGTRPDGPDKSKSWSPIEFREAAGLADKSLSRYLRGKKVDHNKHSSMSQALFGTHPAYTRNGWRQRFYLAWRRLSEEVGPSDDALGGRPAAGNATTPVGPNAAERLDQADMAEAVFDWQVTEETSTKDLAEIILDDPLWGNPTPDEPAHYVIRAQLFMEVAERVKDGKRHRVGASRVIARVKSDDWQPVKASRVGEPTQMIDGVSARARAFEFDRPIDTRTGCLRVRPKTSS